MRLIKNWLDERERTKKKKVLVLQGKMATATRAMYVGDDPNARIVLFMECRQPREDGRSGEMIDAVEFELDMWAASKFASQLLATLDAAMPPRPRGAQKLPFEG